MSSDAHRDSKSVLDHESVRWRLIAARSVLLLGALVQLGLIAGLPLEHLTARERGSLLSLVAMILASITVVAGVSRFPRASVAILGVGCLYAAWIIGRAAYAISSSIRLTGQFPTTPVILAFVIASLGCYSFPIAFLIAWPLRNSADSLHRETV